MEEARPEEGRPEAGAAALRQLRWMRLGAVVICSFVMAVGLMLAVVGLLDHHAHPSHPVAPLLLTSLVFVVVGALVLVGYLRGTKPPAVLQLDQPPPAGQPVLRTTDDPPPQAAGQIKLPLWATRLFLAALIGLMALLWLLHSNRVRVVLLLGFMGPTSPGSAACSSPGCAARPAAGSARRGPWSRSSRRSPTSRTIPTW